jgi:hypothetical protein
LPFAAFSHFTYEASDKEILICDIQGVNDLYTDPQIHNREGIGFGKGNMGERGFERFLATHRCNHICRYLKLPSINAKLIDAGTKAPTTIMSYHKVDVVNVHVPHGPTPQMRGAGRIGMRGMGGMAGMGGMPGMAGMAGMSGTTYDDSMGTESSYYTESPTAASQRVVGGVPGGHVSPAAPPSEGCMCCTVS